MSFYVVDTPVRDFPRITHFGHCVEDVGRDVPCHYHVGFEILYVRKGHAVIETLTNEQPIALVRDTVFIMAPRINHFFRSPPSDLEYFWIGVQTDSLIHVSDDHRVSPQSLTRRGHIMVRDLPAEAHYDELVALGKSLTFQRWVKIDQFPEVCPVFEALDQEINSDQYMKEYVVYAKLIELFSLIHRRLSPYRHTPHSVVLNRVIDHIQAHYTDRLTVDQLARFAGFHPSYLSRLFYREIGTKLSTYVRHVRLINAKRLLLDGYSVGEAARRCGFRNIYTFSAAFKRDVGLSPTDYRTAQDHVAVN